jgi:C4-type Zn-finger protein
MVVCPVCKSTNIIGIEYAYGTPNYYDGVSEWDCEDCGYRVGRFSGRVLTGNETEEI